MPYTVKIITPQNVLLEYEVANLGDRILAFLIDGIIKVGYGLLIFLLLMPQFMSGSFTLLIPLGMILGSPVIFYSLLFEIFNDGQTPGKRALNIKVVSIDGGEVTVAMYILRWLFRLVDINMMSGIIGILTIALTEKSQRVGDLIAGTGVISLKKMMELSNTVFEQLDPEYVPVYNAASRLTNKEVQTIREVLVNKSEDAYELKLLMAEKLENLLGIQKESSSEDFLHTLLKDYNYFQHHP